MSLESEYGTRTRLVRVMRAIIQDPYHYTKKALAEQYGQHPDTIKGDFQAIVNAGFQLDKDDRHRYAFVLEKPYQQLKDLLEQARREKKQVVLEGYRSSNSNTISHRLVEPFHVSPAEDTVQTFEVQKNKVNHFKISRIARVKLLDLPWTHEGWHNIRRTDPFRIVGNEQVTVHLRMGVGAYNELTERFPLTKGSIEEMQETGKYDFQCPVNDQFLGLSNFILGFYHQGIEILAPDSLRDHLRAEVAKMNF